jgi:nucleoside-diphosphate-sugar epimerase
MSILITGATGGFGRIFTKWMEQDAEDQVVITGRAALFRHNYFRCDLECADEIRALLKEVRPRRIFHLAGNFDQDFARCLAVNTMSAKLIFDSLLAEKIEARVVLIGSAAEYGVVVPEENPIREDRILRPVSVYGLTKAYQTQLAHYYSHNHGVDAVVARMFNLFAPGLSERLFVGRVEKLIERLDKGEIEMIDLGNLESRRDYVTSEEAIRQIGLIADHGQRGEVYHVGSGKPMQMRELLDVMLIAAGHDWSVVRTGGATSGRAGYDVPAIYADMDKTLALGDS